MNSILTNFVKSFPRYLKKLILLFLDISLCAITVWLAFYLRTGQFVSFFDGPFFIIIISAVIAIPVFYYKGLYHMLLRHSDWSVIKPVTKAIIIYSIFFFSIIVIFSFKNVPRTIGIIQPILFYIIILISRSFVYYWLSNNPKKKNSNELRVLIYGAGEAGRKLLANFSNNNEVKIFGFLDDNVDLQGSVLNNKKIFSLNKLEDLIKDKDITHVFIAIPSVSRFSRNQIIKKLNEYSLIVRMVPSLMDLANGDIAVSDLRDYEIDDLLAREIVEPKQGMLIKNIESKIVLVTGAGGSIGGELCRQMIYLKPKKILLLENSEFSLYKIQLELNNTIRQIKNINEIEIVPLMGSVQDINFIDKILESWKPDTVYHAAAYKHVSLVEKNLIEGIKNNVYGTINVIKASIKNKVENFVLISTDKAVRPTSIMGASKRLAELCLQALYKDNLDKTTMCMVRFGNALDSSGSVIPLFKKQISEGGPITLTHKDVTRYFMTIPEAAQLVLQASSMAEGGDVFILEMGDPVKIIDLAKRMIKLSGLSIKDENNLEGDIEIREIGLFAGEKLYEELLLGEDPQSTKHPKIKKTKDPFIKWEYLEKDLKKLYSELENNNETAVLEALKKIVKNFA